MNQPAPFHMWKPQQPVHMMGVQNAQYPTGDQIPQPQYPYFMGKPLHEGNEVPAESCGEPGPPVAPPLLKQAPLTPNGNQLPSLIHSQNQTPRSPLLLASHNSNSSHHTATSLLNPNADNSNMSFSQDHDDDSSMTSDEPSCSSPARMTSGGGGGGGGGTINTSAKSLASIAAHNAEILQKLMEMSDPQDGVNKEHRRDLIGKLQRTWEEHNIHCRNLPNISKQTLDLCKLYWLVKEKGGSQECNRSKLWKDISIALNMGSLAAHALILKRKYAQLGLLYIECKYELNGLDPAPIMAEMEKTNSTSKKQQPVAVKSGEQGAGSTPSTPSGAGNNVSGLSNPGSVTASAKKSKRGGKDKADKQQQQVVNAPAVASPQPNTTPQPSKLSSNLEII